MTWKIIDKGEPLRCAGDKPRAITVEADQFSAWMKWDGCVEISQKGRNPDTGEMEVEDTIHVCDLAGFRDQLTDLIENFQPITLQES